MGGNASTEQIPGRAFPARSSRETAARLEFSGELVSIIDQDDEIIAACLPDQLDWDMPVGQAPRRVNFPDGSMFEAADNAAIDALRQNSGWNRLHRAERFGKPLVLVVLGSILGAFLLWRYALPGLVSVAVFMTPDPVRDLMDQGTLAGLDRAFAEPTKLEQERQSEIEDIFARLQAALPPEHSDTEFNLEFRSTPLIGPNAFALPGGTVVITDQLVRAFKGDDVVAGVLAHEIGHVTGDHGLRQLYRSLGVFVMISIMAGDTGPILEDVLLEGGVLLSLSYSRAHERAADDFGLKLTTDAGFEPSGLLTFFQSLPDAQNTRSSWMSTHPASGERMEAIQKFLDER